MAEMLPPVLTLHLIGPGQYAMRLTDQRYNSIAAAISKLVPDMASLLLITPTEMRQFVMDGTSKQIAQAPVESQNEDVEQLYADAYAATDQEPVPPSKRTRTRSKGPDRQSSTQGTEACGRCGGAGQIQQLLEGGKSAVGSCPVCQGQGHITRFGKGR